jgi:hypothetical protein
MSPRQGTTQLKGEKRSISPVFRSIAMAAKARYSSARTFQVA